MAKTQPGGLYKVGGQLVNAEGKPVTKQKGSAAAAEGDSGSGTAAGGLDSIDFAHPSARAKAEELGLSAESFKRKRKASERGFTVADVERIAGAQDAEEE